MEVLGAKQGKGDAMLIPMNSFLLFWVQFWSKSIKKCNHENAYRWRDANWFCNLSISSNAICHSYGTDNNS